LESFGTHRHQRIEYRLAHLKFALTPVCLCVFGASVLVRLADQHLAGSEVNVLPFQAVYLAGP
jgi:hypothetical protein